MITERDYQLYAEAMATLCGIDQKRAQAIGRADQKLAAALAEADRRFESEKDSFSDVSRDIRSADSAMQAVFRELSAPPIAVGNPSARLSSMRDVQRVAHEEKVWAERAIATVQSLRRTLARLEAQPRMAAPPVTMPPAHPENPNKMYIVAVVVAAVILLIMILIAFT